MSSGKLPSVSRRPAINLNVAPKPLTLNQTSSNSINTVSAVRTSNYPTISLDQTGAPKSPSARSSVLNLRNNKSAISVANTIPPSMNIIDSNSYIEVTSTNDSDSNGIEFRDFEGVLTGSSIENELLTLGYVPVSRVIVRNHRDNTKYIKCLNKYGQSVYVLIDEAGFTTARPSDLYLYESADVTIMPYSAKIGSYECAKSDVCGVAFECGSNGICTMIREPQSLDPVETNYIFKSEHTNGVVTDVDSSISYPVVRLSEIRANNQLVLENTAKVLRQLRNSEYKEMIQELALTQKAIIELQSKFEDYNLLREKAAEQIHTTLSKLEGWNDEYLRIPPTTDADREAYKRIQTNLVFRNKAIITMLHSMRKISELRFSIEKVTETIGEITDLCQEDFGKLPFAVEDPVL